MIKMVDCFIAVYVVIVLVAIGCASLKDAPAKSVLDTVQSSGCAEACYRIEKKIDMDECVDVCMALVDTLEDNID